MIRLLVSLVLIYVIGVGTGYLIGHDNGRKQCPSNALSHHISKGGSVECVLKIDRDPAKVTMRVKI